MGTSSIISCVILIHIDIQIYDVSVIDGMRASAHEAGKEGIEFFDPPASMFFDYELGRNSPYGEQLLALLESLAGMFAV